jgi:threonyl-tRNA synthetase
MVIVGDKEAETGQVTWRSRAGVDLGMMTIESICDRMRQEILSKR